MGAESRPLRTRKIFFSTYGIAEKSSSQEPCQKANRAVAERSRVASSDWLQSIGRLSAVIAFAAARELADRREWAANATPLAEDIKEDFSGALSAGLERRGGMHRDTATVQFHRATARERVASG